MEPHDYNILELIPQRPPIVMVDKLLRVDGNFSLTLLNIKEDNIFCRNGKFTEPGIIENIAQSAAAKAGYLCKKEDADVRLGFIGNIKNLHIYLLPETGNELYTEIIHENEIMGVTIITAKSKCNDQLVAECEMKIFLQ